MNSSHTLAVVGATIIDGHGGKPIENGVVVIEGERIKAVGSRATPIPPGAKAIDAAGKFVIPGLMDSNVHLLGGLSLEKLARYEDRYDELITEAAQIALKGGLTTVFDTWGPRKPLMAVRDRVAKGEIPGSRIYCAGNIIGLDGPFSLDFQDKALAVASAGLVQRVNATWVENSGPDLTWMTPEQVGEEVKTYIRRGVDFIKYASSEHRGQEHEATTSILFSHYAQAKIVEAAHELGVTAQAHTSSVESLRIAVEAGCDLIQHCNFSGPVAIPETTFAAMAERKTGAVVFAFTERRLDWLMKSVQPLMRRLFWMGEENARAVMRSGAPILLGSDATVTPAIVAGHAHWMAAGEDNLGALGEGHFHWLKAMEEKGFSPMEGLQAATRNIAVAYKMDKDLGTVEAGKFADLLILDKNPLEKAAHYQSIHAILKGGKVVDRDALPATPILTKARQEPDDSITSYGRFAISKYPCC